MKTVPYVLVLAGSLLASGCMTLHEAAAQGDLARVQSLVRSGTPVESRGQLGATPLFGAARGGHVDVAEFLLAEGADVDTRAEEGHTALMVAAAGGPTNTVSVLIEKGAAVNSPRAAWDEGSCSAGGVLL